MIRSWQLAFSSCALNFKLGTVTYYCNKATRNRHCLSRQGNSGILGTSLKERVKSFVAFLRYNEYRLRLGGLCAVLAAVMVGDGKASVFAEGFWGDFYAGRRESSLVFVSVNHTDDFLDHIGG